MKSNLNKIYKNQYHSLCLILFSSFSTSNKSVENLKQVSPKFNLSLINEI